MRLTQANLNLFLQLKILIRVSGVGFTVRLVVTVGTSPCQWAPRRGRDRKLLVRDFPTLESSPSLLHITTLFVGFTVSTPKKYVLYFLCARHIAAPSVPRKVPRLDHLGNWSWEQQL